MAAEVARWQKAEDDKPDTDEAAIRYQAEYVQRLIDRTDYPSFDIEGVVQTFLEWEHNKHEDIMTFRDKSHQSLMTAGPTPPHHTPWLTAFDDSAECYVARNKEAALRLEQARRDPAVAEALRLFPGAEILAVRDAVSADDGKDETRTTEKRA